MEIGSEFWIDNTLYNKKVESVGDTPFWLRKYGEVMLTSSGRGAISLILDQINPSLKRALLPSYICDSILLPFQKAGYELIFYDVDIHLCPINIDLDNLEIGIFFHMGYFGFPTNMVLKDQITKLSKKSVIIIEDVTHTLFSNYDNHKLNDYVIGSIRKWFGIPCGGFVSSNKLKYSQLSFPSIKFVNLRETSLHQKFEYLRTQDKSLKDTYLKGFSIAEKILDEDVDGYAIDSMSEMIINVIDINDIVQIRKSNFEFLLTHLKYIKNIKVIFDEVNFEITPMFFPIYVNCNRDKLKTDLIYNDIYCPIHWPIPRQLEGTLNSTTKNIYDSILSIPCDQRYGINDMKRIVDVLEKLV